MLELCSYVFKSVCDCQESMYYKILLYSIIKLHSFLIVWNDSTVLEQIFDMNNKRFEIIKNENK